MRVGALAAAALVIVLAIGVGPAAAESVDMQVPLPAGVSVPDNHVRVLLPDGYRDDPCRRYPVLYLLHGVGDRWQDWSTKSDLIEFVRELPVIVVTPDGGKTPNAGWYSDWLDGTRQYEKFHVDTLVSWVDANFRTMGDGHRLIAGFSMGGFGAMSYAARHPGMFKAAAAFSGIVDSMYAFPASGPFFATLHERFGTPDDRVWGDQLQDESVWRAHNPTDLAAAMQGTALFLYAGEGAPLGASGDDPQKTQNYAIEQFVFQTNLSFASALRRAGVPVTSDFHAGYHDWPYFQAGLHWALPQMLPLVGGAVATACVAPTAVVAPASSNRRTLPATGAAGDPLVPLLVLVVAIVLRRKVRVDG